LDPIRGLTSFRTFAPMKLTAHLGKITWSLADKGLYVLYGLVQLYQFAILPPDAYGMFTLLVSMNTWIMIVSDGSALQGIIQFGTQESERRRINTMALIIHVAITAISIGLLWAFLGPLSRLYDDDRFATVAAMLPLYCLLTMPRMFCLKIFYRDLRIRDLFITDAVWFGVRTIMTFHAVQTSSLATLEDIIRIDFVGMAASSLMALVLARKSLVFGFAGTVRFADYFKFGVPMAAATALYATPRQLDVMIIAGYFGPAVAGFYNQAKNLFRFFEQAFDAVTTLLYPAAVRMHSQQRFDDLRILVTKAISVTLLPTVFAIIVLELGGSDLIPTLLGEKFRQVVPHFNVLLFATLGMPFLLMSSVIAAYGRSTIVVRYTAVGLLAGLVTLFAVGEFGQPDFVGLALVINSLVVGGLCFVYVRTELQFPWSAMFRAARDVRNAITRRKPEDV